MKRCMLALDVQNYFKPSMGVVQQINQLTTQIPTIATLFKLNEDEIPLGKMGKTAPEMDDCLINTSNVVYKHGYLIPQTAINWLKDQNADEVLLVGGHTDANVLAAGFSLFDAGFTPALIPMLCYGNDWYMHTVTTGIWAQELGKVYENTAEMMFAG